MIINALGLLSSDILHLFYTYTLIIFKTYIFSLYKHKEKTLLEKNIKRCKPFTTFAEKAVHIATLQLLKEDRVPDSLLFRLQFLEVKQSD